jgi:hypothetical protein
MPKEEKATNDEIRKRSETERAGENYADETEWEAKKD